MEDATEFGGLEIGFGARANPITPGRPKQPPPAAIDFSPASLAADQIVWYLLLEQLRPRRKLRHNRWSASALLRDIPMCSSYGTV